MTAKIRYNELILSMEALTNMESMKQRMLGGKLYKANDPEISVESQRGSDLVWQFNHLAPDKKAERAAVLKQLFHAFGDNNYIEPPFYVDYGAHTSIGDHFYANTDCVFLDTAPITIGNRVYLAPKVSLFTAGHPIDAAIRGEDLEYGKPIKIGDDVWIGGNATLNPGVTIGNNVVIGSGSVVTHDIPANSVAVGNPCRVIWPITADDKTEWENQEAEYRKSLK